MSHGVNGYLASDEEDFAARLLELIDDPDSAERLGEAGGHMVKERYLITRYLADELRLIGDLLTHSRPNADKGVLLHA